MMAISFKVFRRRIKRVHTLGQLSIVVSFERSEVGSRLGLVYWEKARC